MTAKKTEKDIVSVPGTELLPIGITPEAARSLMTLQTGDVPKDAISEHPGKGGKVFSYIDHVYGRSLLWNVQWDIPFDWNVKSYELFPDDSAIVLGELAIYVHHSTYGTMRLTTTEVGMFEGNSKMSNAAKVASAASRSFVKCLFARFGIGKELYKSDNPDKMDRTAAWGVLVAYGESNKPPVEAEDIKTKLKENGIKTWDDVLNRFHEAYAIVGKMRLEARKPKKQAPDLEGEKEEKKNG